MTAQIELVHLFNRDVDSVERSGRQITLNIRDWRPVRFSARSDGLADAIMALRNGATIERLETCCDREKAPGEFAQELRYYLERFARGRFLAWDIVDAGMRLGRADALASRFQPNLDRQTPSAVVLGRFSLLRRDDGSTVLETAAAPVRLVLSRNGLDRLTPLLEGEHPCSAGTLPHRLWQLGFFDAATAEESEARRCWEFHDLLMHQRSRQNLDVPTIGGTYRFKGVFPSLPARRPAFDGQALALPAVDRTAVARNSAPLHEVQERRKSLRKYAEQPVDLASVSEFLWRTCRTVREIESNQQGLLTRPYPAGGSINELEFYVAVRRCGGLEPGVYHYDGHRHAVVGLPGTEPLAQKIVSRSTAAMGLVTGEESPDIVIVVTSRFPRLAWKYEGMAYRATLLNAGVVLGQMYLIATDMGLAPCANGTGDSRLLEEAAGLDPFAETPIAEFALSRPGQDLA